MEEEETLLGLMVPPPLPQDCCDGTDEYNSGIVCENTCRYVGAPPHPPSPQDLALPGESGPLSFLCLSIKCSVCARCLVRAPSGREGSAVICMFNRSRSSSSEGKWLFQGHVARR